MADTLSVYHSMSEKKKTLPLKALRRLSQALFLGILGQWSFYGIFRCPFLVPYVSCQNCPVITCHGRIFTMFWGFGCFCPSLFCWLAGLFAVGPAPADL